MRISDWSSDVCSSDLCPADARRLVREGAARILWSSNANAASRGAVLASTLYRDRNHVAPSPAKRGSGNRCSISSHGQSVSMVGPDDIWYKEGRIAVGLPDRISSLGQSGVRREPGPPRADQERSEEHTSELTSLMRISYAVFCLKKKNNSRTVN